MFGQPTNSPFGASAPSTPFGAPAPAAPFGSSSTPAFGGGFGAQQPTVPTFGGFGQQQQQATQTSVASAGAFGGGFGTYGSAAPAPSGAFGASSTPFGAPVSAPNTGLFGASAPAPTGGLFGSNAAPSAFGGLPPASTGFGGFAPATTSAFGSGSAFGAPAPTPNTGLFGAPAPSAFGAPSVFGAPAQPPPLFGATPAPSGGMFGSTSSAPPSVGVGSKVVPFATTTSQDGTGNSSQLINLQSITAMKPYETKTFEELRFEDYTLGNRGDGTSLSSAPTGFGGFGAPAPAPTGFGSTGGFGASSGSSAFGTPTPSAFGAPAPSTFSTAVAPPAFGGFGAPAPASSGLFGSPAPAPSAFGAAPAPASGLFGSAPAPGAGLFGSTQAPAFGAPAPSGSGLFGAPAPTSGSLFGASAPSSSGLFGAPTPGGLFGAATPAPAGLFGAPAPSTGGLFGSPSPAPAFGAPAPSAGGLFGAPAPAPVGGVFGAPAPAPGAFGGFGAQTPAPGGLFGSPSPAHAFGSTFGPPLQVAPGGGGIFGSPAPAFSYPAAPPQNIVHQAADAALRQRLDAIQQQEKDLEKMHVWRGKSFNDSVVVPGSLPESDAFRISPYSESTSNYRASPKWSQKIKPRGFGMNSPPGSSISSFQGSRTPGTPVHTPSSIAASSAKRLVIRQSNTPKPEIRLRLDLNGGDGKTPIAPFNGVSSVENNVASPPATLHTPALIAMKEGGPRSSEKKPVVATDSAEEFYHQVVGSPKETPLRHTSKHFLPKLTKSGYITSPFLSEMATMSEADLAALPGFSIFRHGYGKVAWEGNVDVRGIDLDSVISIEDQDVSVYEQQEADGTKPSVGEKLNRPAIISLFNIFPKKGGANASPEVKEKYKKKLVNATVGLNAEFISYDCEKGIWVFKVHHFSRYRLVDDDSDDEIEEPDASHRNTADMLTTFQKSNADAMANFESGEYGGCSLVLEKYASPTRFVVPSDDDDTDLEMMVEDDVAVIRDPSLTLTIEIANSMQGAYEAMFLSPRALSKPLAVVELDAKDIYEEEGQYPTATFSRSVEPPRESDMMINRHGGICSRIMADQGLLKSSVDVGLRMGRSFRVGWRPDGSYLHVNSGTVLVQSRPLFSETDVTRTTALVLGIHSKCKHANHNPCLTMDGLSRSELAVAIEEMVGIILSTGKNSYSHSALHQSLALILCLLKSGVASRGDGSELALAGKDFATMSLESIQTMEAFYQWLQGASAATARTDIARANERGDVHAAIFAALSCGDVAAAAAIATGNGYLQLAAIIVAGRSASPFIRDQVRHWYQTGASAKIDPTLMRIYKLLGGEFDFEERIFQSGDVCCGWMMRLGLLLCYGTKDDGSTFDFSSLVEKYDQDVKAGLAPEPEPLYLRGERNPARIKSVLYSIIRLSNAIAQGLDSKVPLRDVIQPEGHTPSHHDFAGSFLLAVVLSSLKCCSNLTEIEQARLLSGYASQLLSVGKWESAVYVILSFVGSTSSRQWRLKQAKEIVLQHYRSDDKFIAQFLTEKIGLPRAWLQEALADRNANAGQLFDYVNHLSEISHEKARDALERSLVPTILFQNQHAAKDSLNMLKALTPVADESLTSTIVQFFDLSSAIKNVDLQLLDNKLSYLKVLQAKADCIEQRFVRHMAAVDSTMSEMSPRIARVEIPMDCFLSECLSGVSFFKLQLRALELGSSIWDESGGGGDGLPMRLASQLVAYSGDGVKSNALRGYS